MPTLEITTMIGCPLQCTFCPQDKLVKNYPPDAPRALRLTDFIHILSKVPQYVRIDFSGLSEPWANRMATGMLREALKRGHNVTIYTTLQGMRDYTSVISLLVAHRKQVERIIIHLPDDQGNMIGFAPTDTYRAALIAFQDAHNNGDLDVGFMTMSDFSVFGTPSIDWDPLTRAGNLDLVRIGDQRIEDASYHRTPLCCSYTPFYDHNVLLPNGDVVLCCMDYSLEHKLGNLLKSSYFDLFRSQVMEDLRLENMRYAPSYSDGGSLCRKCSRAKTFDLRSGNHQFWEDPEEQQEIGDAV